MLKILIAEDELLLRKALIKILTEAGYNICYEASNGKLALDYLITHKADILITDIRMPVMDGLELITEINKRSLSVKTIVISGYNDFEYARHMLKNGVSVYLLKPVVPRELLDNIVEVGRTLKNEENDQQILRSHKFNALQRQQYVRFSSEMPNQILNSSSLFACCVDFENPFTITEIQIWQKEIEYLAYPCCCFLLDGYLYVVIPLDEQGKERIDQTTIIQSFFLSKNVNTRIGVGRCVKNIMTLNQSMKEARKSLDQYQGLSLNEIADYERVAHLLNAEINYPLALEKELLDSISFQDWDHTDTCITHLYEYIRANSKETRSKMLTELCVACKRAFENYKMPDLWDECMNMLREAYDFDVFFQSLRKVLFQYNNHIQNARKMANTSVIEKACLYIRRNISEPLSLDSVADYCYLSKSHFCKLFKEEVHMTFIEYVNHWRIEYAKELIKTTNYKNYEIANKIGYEDASYFNKIFKQSTGLTPSQYRNC